MRSYGFLWVSLLALWSIGVKQRYAVTFRTVCDKYNFFLGHIRSPAINEGLAYVRNDAVTFKKGHPHQQPDFVQEFIPLQLLHKAPTPQNKKVTKRITHGTVTSIAEHPHQVALLERGNSHILCGGALISHQVVLTAAHCTHGVTSLPRKDLSVLVGADYLGDSRGQILKIKTAMKHPGFDYRKFDKDLSVILLEESVKIGGRASPIPLAYKDYPPGTKGVVSGWGLTEFGAPSKDLRATAAILENPSKCQQYFPRFNNPLITENMICVKPGTMSSHYGDSGGPLVIDGKLVGLVSFGRPVSGKTKVTVFTKVKNFVDFIHEVVPFFR